VNKETNYKYKTLTPYHASERQWDKMKSWPKREDDKPGMTLAMRVGEDLPF